MINDYQQMKQFVKALNDNLEAWFEIWDKNVVQSQESIPPAETEAPPSEDFDIEKTKRCLSELESTISMGAALPCPTRAVNHEQIGTTARHDHGRGRYG